MYEDSKDKTDRFVFRPLMLAIDRRLRDWNAVVEYTSDLRCILRIRIGRLDHLRVDGKRD